MRKKRRFSGIIKFIGFILIAAVISIFLLYTRVFPLKYYDIVKKYASIYNLDPLRVMAVIKAESNFNENAKSIKDAYGLMQITDPTAQWAAQKMNIEYGGKDQLLDEEYNIRMGCWYLNNLREEFNDWDLIIAAYNGGRGNVNKWLKSKQHSDDGSSLTNIPFPETDKYVKKVNTNYKIYKFMYR